MAAATVGMIFVTGIFGVVLSPIGLTMNITVKIR